MAHYAKKYVLAPDYDERLGGKLSHIVVMQHVTKAKLQKFLDDLSTNMNKRSLKPIRATPQTNDLLLLQ